MKMHNERKLLIYRRIIQWNYLSNNYLTKFQPCSSCLIYLGQADKYSSPLPIIKCTKLFLCIKL